MMPLIRRSIFRIISDTGFKKEKDVVNIDSHLIDFRFLLFALSLGYLTLQTRQNS